MDKNLLIIVALSISVAYSNSAFTNGMSSTACTSANCNIINNCKCNNLHFLKHPFTFLIINLFLIFSKNN